MLVESFFLRHFRRFEEKAFSFLPGINFILGPNGSGKTTLLEALSLLSTATSFRTHNLVECIQESRPQFVVAARFYKKGVEETLQVYLSPDKKICQHHTTQHKSFSPLLGMLPAVVMRPEDMGLIRGGPKERRDYMDLELSKKDPLYYHYLKRYQKAMKHRNVLLKDRNTSLLFPWEKQMASAAAYLVSARRELLLRLQGEVDAMQEKGEMWKLSYKQEGDAGRSENDFLKAYERSRPRELAFGSTLVGPQRDDVDFFFNGKVAKSYASDGQARTFLFFLKVAELTLAKNDSGEAPLLLIDEWTTSLDPRRKERLSSLFQKAGQVIMTGLEPLHFLENMHLLELN